MGKLERLYHLHEILKARRRPISRRALMDELGCSQATLYRLVASLRDELGAPLEQDPESKGYYYDPALGTFELPGIWLSPDQVQSLVAARALLNRVQPGLLDEELDGLKARIGALLAERGLDDGAADRYIRIIHHAGREAPRAVFRTALSALLAGRRLALRYAGRTSDTETVRTISPQRLTAYRERWYLDAWCHLRQGLRSFALERIVDLEAVDEPRRRIDDETLAAHFQAAYGIFAGPAENEARLLFSQRAARWVMDERWHSRQAGRTLPDGRYELRIPFGRSEELVMDLLRYGPDVVVCEPPALRRAVARRLREALGHYGDDG